MLGIARSTFYSLVSDTPSQRRIETQAITQAIDQLYHDANGIYGAPKIQFLLQQDYDLIVGIKRVQRIMAAHGWRSITVKKYRPASNHEVVFDRSNLLNQDFKTTSMNQKWLADMTYVYTIKEGWTYLASVMDLWSRRIIGYAYATKMDANLVIKALNNATMNRKIKGKRLIVHTDLGSQYTGFAFENKLHELGLIHSYSRKGTPYDNAGIESFHATLKKEEVYVSSYQTAKKAKMQLFQYIEGWYNRKRIHGAIGYLTPVAFEQQ